MRPGMFSAHNALRRAKSIGTILEIPQRVNLSSFKAVLFDYDDTLANTYSARVKAAKKGADGRLSSDLDMDKIMKEWAGRP